ncbi:MAG: 30S ribosomal protein S21 [Deltaproteobacteria bacterium]|nr:30S ribosomal protein S21 [Deltaproteobacteria bacterium]
MEVRVVDNQVEKAIRQLKRKIATEGVMKDLKRKRFYMKPSVRKKLKQKEAEKRRQKAKRYRSY